MRSKWTSGKTKEAQQIEVLKEKGILDKGKGVLKESSKEMEQRKNYGKSRQTDDSLNQNIERDDYVGKSPMSLGTMERGGGRRGRGGRFSWGSRGGSMGRGFGGRHKQSFESEGDQSEPRDYETSEHNPFESEDGKGYEAGTETFNPGDTRKKNEEDDLTEEEIEEMARQSEVPMDLDKKMQQGHNTPPRVGKGEFVKTRAQKQRAAMAKGGGASCDELK